MIAQFGIPHLLRRQTCFVAGWTVLAAALVSPLCRLAATLVSAHMVQHVLLVAVAPVLLALGATGASAQQRRSMAIRAPRSSGRSPVPRR